jgi:hypothetical protein
LVLLKHAVYNPVADILAFCPFPRGNYLNLYVRKIGHVFSYGMLYFLWFMAFHGDLGIQRRFASLYSLVLCLGLAIIDEGRQ